MKPEEYPKGARLLVSWYIRRERESYSAGCIPISDWELNSSTVTEIQVLEWSPSGSHVRVKCRRDDPAMWSGEDGWYAAHRIHVVEELPA